MAREAFTVETVRHILHLAGYRCANPACRHILTIDIHHIEQVSEGGKNDRENLIALCPNCHALHHRGGTITKESIRAWHQLLIALNEAYPRNAVDLLLALHKMGKLRVSGDGVLQVSSAIAAGLVTATKERKDSTVFEWEYELILSDRGNTFVNAWLAGDERKAVEAGLG